MDGGLVLGLGDVEKRGHLDVVLEHIMRSFVMFKDMVVGVIIFYFLVNDVCPDFFVVVKVTCAWILIIEVFKTWNDSFDGRL